MSELIRNEAEAIDCLKKNRPSSGFYMLQESVDMAFKALSEIQQYRAIGTVSDFRELKEKATAKKVQYDEYGRDEGYPHCSRCSDSLINDFVNVNYCPCCGQRLLWE